MAMTKELEVKLTADLSQLTAGLKKAETNIDQVGRKTSGNLESSWTNGLSKIGAAISGAFAVSALVGFSKEAIEIAAKAEGIEAAFKRLNNPTLLSNLRDATKGTITDLELMRQAVRAQNFQIPLEKLATFFEFATKRSAQTGESVDYLVNSIIDGIGRKSTLVLDNLGISASRLQEEVKKVGDFGLAAGNIIQEEIGKAGDVALTSAQKIAQFNVDLENQKKIIGEQLTPAYLDLLTAISKTIEGLSNMASFWSDFTFAPIAINTDSFTKLERAMGRILTVEEKRSIKSRGFSSEQRKLIETQGDLTTRFEQFLLMLKEVSKEEENSTGKTKDKTTTIEEQTAALEAATAAQEKLMMLQSGLVGLNNGTITGPGNALANVTPEDLAGLQDFIDQDLSGIENLDKASQEFFAQRQLDFENLSNTAQFFGNSLQNAFLQGMEEGSNFGEIMGEMLLTLIKQLAAAAAAAALLTLLLPSFGVTQIGGKALDFKNIFGLLSGVPFANGGIVSGPTLGLVGEYSGARTNPEVIAPLDKLKSMMGGMMQSGTQRVIVEGRISGNDIVLSNERTMYNRKRQRGY